jgi:hypothetical protein
LLVDDSTVTADLHGISTVALVGCHELHHAVAVSWLYQSTNAATHWKAVSTLVKGRLGRWPIFAGIAGFFSELLEITHSLVKSALLVHSLRNLLAPWGLVYSIMLLCCNIAK